jgi:hypothetical protein
MSEVKKMAVYNPGAKAMFVKWIAERGGVKVWENVDLSNCDAGPMWTPVRDAEGKDVTSPRWSHPKCVEIVTDLSRFKFIKDMKEVKRFHVAVRMGDSGLRIKCTDASSRKIKSQLAKAGPEACYRFDYDTQEAVIEVPVWDEENVECKTRAS